MDKMDDNMALLLISRLMTAENQHTHHAAYNHIAARVEEVVNILMASGYR